MLDFVEVDSSNYHSIHELYPGDKAKYWVNYNWYWTELALRRSEVRTQLVTLTKYGAVFGFIAIGKHYSDRLLKCEVEGCYEIYHMVIDQNFQRQGIGLATTVKAIRLLMTFENCEKIRIAHHPDNTGARELYVKLGFIDVGRNYDDDPMLELDVSRFLPLPTAEICVRDFKQTISESWREGSIQSQKEFNWDDWENGLVT